MDLAPAQGHGKRQDQADGGRVPLSTRAVIGIWGAALTALAGGLRLTWVLTVPTVPVSDFAMYRESANYLSEIGTLDPGFIYMPGFVVLLAWVKDLGGDLLAQKLTGVLFGAVGGAAIFFLSGALLDRERGGTVAAAPPWRRICPWPRAALAAALYACWPAGVAMSSVVGTDVPAAALMVAGLALLATFGPRRPFLAAVAFGATMGLAAWIRAVSLPLAGLALGYWLACRVPIRRAVLLTAVGLGTTLLVLLPWGVRHLRESGDFYFTDDHGGITALIGANPNSEGTYTRALNQTFEEVTGRGVLDLPHRETDRAAYALAREWLAFEPTYALGLAVKKAERLFDPERRLLYWPVYRPGVLVGAPADWFAARRSAIHALADGFAGVALVLALAGIGMAALRRRWDVMSLLPFQLALVATYTTFFAEPRYRIPIEMLAFPFVALAVGELVRLAARVRGASRTALRQVIPVMGPVAIGILCWQLGWPALVKMGAGLRRRHRWAVTRGTLDGGPRLVLWKPAVGPSGELPATSVVAGGWDGLRLTIPPTGAAAARGLVGGGPLPAGRYAVELPARADLAGGTHPPGAAPLRVSLGGGEVVFDGSEPASPRAEVLHSGGRLGLDLRATGRPSDTVWLGAPRLSTVP